MTARTTWPATPESLAAAFVSVAERVVAQCLANFPGINRQQATLRLVCVLGGGWLVTVGSQALGEGADLTLAEAARGVVRASVHALDIESQGRLMQRMDDGADPPPGTAVPHFKALLAMTGETWELKVVACARGASAVVAALDGVLLEPAARAAA